MEAMLTGPKLMHRLYASYLTFRQKFSITLQNKTFHNVSFSLLTSLTWQQHNFSDTLFLFEHSELELAHLTTEEQQHIVLLLNVSAQYIVGRF